MVMVKIGMVIRQDMSQYSSKLDIIEISTDWLHMQDRAKEMQKRNIKCGNGGLWNYQYKAKFVDIFPSDLKLKYYNNRCVSEDWP